MTLDPLRPSTLAQQAADAIRQQIASGDLRSGERLIEAQIASQLEISRGPVREALKLLSAEGLVREEPRRGMFVTKLTQSDVCEIYDLRIAIECRAVRLLIERGQESAVRALEALLVELRRAAGRSDAARIDFRFHKSVCSLSGNRRLHDVFVRHATELKTLLRIDDESTSEEGDLIVRQHEELVEVLAAGDADAAEASFRRHLEEARDRMAAYFGSLPGAAQSASRFSGPWLNRRSGR